MVMHVQWYIVGGACVRMHCRGTCIVVHCRGALHGCIGGCIAGVSVGVHMPMEVQD